MQMALKTAIVLRGCSFTVTKLSLYNMSSDKQMFIHDTECINAVFYDGHYTA